MRQPTTLVLRAVFINVQCVCDKLACKALRHNQAQVNQVDVSDPVKALTEQVQSLASGLNSIDSAQLKTEKASTSPDVTHSSTSTSVPAFGRPAVSDISTQIQNCLNLSEKNILWCKVESGDIPIYLLIDSCCSVSFSTCYECNPIPVSVVSPQVHPISTGREVFSTSTFAFGL